MRDILIPLAVGFVGGTFLGPWLVAKAKALLAKPKGWFGRHDK